MAELPAIIGITLKKDSIVLTYKVGKHLDKDNISWKWEAVEGGYVAKFKAVTKTGDIKYHNSAIVDAATHENLEEQVDQKPDGEFYTVILKKKKKGTLEDLHKFFDVAQE